MIDSIDYKALFEDGPSPYLLLSPEAGFPILGASKLYLESTHTVLEQIYLRLLFEVFPDDPDDPTADGERNLRASLASVLRTGLPDVLPLQRYAVRDPARERQFQERYWSCSNSPVLDAAGKIRYIVHRAEDVTDLIQITGDFPLNAIELQTQLFRRTRDLENLNRQMSEANKGQLTSVKRYRQLAESSTFGLSFADLTGRITYLNPALQSLLGYTPKDIAEGAIRWDSITQSSYADRDTKATQELQKHGSCAPYEKACITKDGREVPILLAASTLTGMDGQVEVAAFVLDLSEKVRVEELLRASDLRNRTLIESLPQLVWSCRKDGYCTYLSSQWVSYTGVPEQEQLGFEWLDRVMHPNDRDRTFQAWMLAVSGAAPYDLEYRLRRYDGVYRWFKTRGIPVLSEAGEILEWFGTCTDIDDQIRSEQEARRAVEERERLWREFDTALSNTADLNYSFDLDGRYTYANRALLSLLRKTLPELVGRTFRELDYPPDLADKLQRQIQAVIATRKLIRDETPFTDPSGRTGYYDYIFAPVFSEGRVEAVTGSTRDITERKLTEETLLENEQRLRFALQAGRMNSWEYGPALFERHAGGWENRTAGLVVWNSQTLRRILSSEEQHRVENLFERALREGTEVETEIYVRPEGSENRWLWVRGASNPDSDGQPRISGLISDITERRVLEERFRESARLESVGVLAGGIAHDFNNLLTGILGNSSLAMEEVGSEHPVTPLLEGVVRASERAATLTNQMLAYSGRGKFVVRYIELSSFIREVSAMIRASIPRHVTLNLNLQQPLPLIQADVTQLQQVIMNLIVNAAEAIPATRRGEVHVTSMACDLTAAQISSLRNALESEPGRFVCLAVQDNGSGMDEATRNKMFDPFFTTKFTGRGLGLSAVLGILRGHKGAIGIESQPGQGTTIKVYLPIARVAGGTVEETAAIPSAVGNGTILVVDDEETVRSVASKMLKHSGYDVLLANDGEEAVRIFRERHHEVRAILLDLSMPVMDGESALPFLKEINPNVPIILSTGYTDVESSVRLAPDQLAGVLQKPYKPAQLKEVLQRALNGD